MKKSCILFLAIILLVSMTGCKDKAASDPVTLTMWHVYGSQGKRDWYRHLCCLRHKFNRH